MPAVKKSLYRITYIQQNSIYEIFARKIVQSDIFGFLEIEDIVFNTSSVVVDPSEERLRSEFDGVNRLMVPVQLVLRIDSIDAPKSGMTSKIRGAEGSSKKGGGGNANVHSLFPKPPGDRA